MDAILAYALGGVVVYYSVGLAAGGTLRTLTPGANS